MILLSALQAPPSSSSSLSTQPAGAKRPLELAMQETLQGDVVGEDDLQNSSATYQQDENPSLSQMSSLSYAPTPTDGTAAPSSQNKRRRIDSVPNLPARTCSPSSGPTSFQDQVQSNNVYALLTRVCSIVLAIDEEQRSHRRKTDKTLDVINNDVVDRARRIEETLVDNHAEAEGWKDEIIKKIEEVHGENLEKLEEVNHIQIEKIDRLEKEIEGLKSALAQILTHHSNAATQQPLSEAISATTSTAKMIPSSTVERPPPMLRDSSMLVGHDQDQDDDLAEMTLGMDTDMSIHEFDTGVDYLTSFTHSDTMDMDGLAPFQYAVNPKDIMPSPRLELDLDQPSTSMSTSTARLGHGSDVAGPMESSTSSRTWWNTGGGKSMPVQTDHGGDRDNESPSEQRVVTPHTAEQSQAPSPQIIDAPQINQITKSAADDADNREEEDELDEEEHTSRPTARLPFPTRLGLSPSASTKGKRPGRPRKSESTSTPSTKVEHIAHRSKTVQTTSKNEKTVRRSSRARSERVSYMEEVEEKKTKYKPKTDGVRQRRFYGKIMLTTKGLLAGNGVKNTEARWPQKGAYTVRSKLEEIVCDACRGRCHWACAGLDPEADMSERAWLCPDCEHVVKVDGELHPAWGPLLADRSSGKPRASIDTVQQVRCIRYNCVLRDKKAIEVRDGEEDLYIVEKLAGQRAIARKPNSHERIFEYLVKWEGYDWDDCSWEPAAHLPAHHENLIATFRETAQSLSISVKLKVAILPEARQFWDPVTGDYIAPPDEESRATSVVRSKSVSAPVERSERTRARQSSINDKDRTSNEAEVLNEQGSDGKDDGGEKIREELELGAPAGGMERSESQSVYSEEGSAGDAGVADEGEGNEHIQNGREAGKSDEIEVGGGSIAQDAQATS